jgi:hypothetical protein
MRFTTSTARAFGATVLLGLAMPAAVLASELGYTYVEARYLDVDARRGSDADGGTVIGWYRPHQNFFLIGQAVRIEADSGAEATTGVAGAGLILPLGERWDAVAIGTYRHTGIDRASGDLDENGYGAQIGLRGMPIPKVETRLFANYVDVIGQDTSAFVSVDYWFSPRFAAGVAAELGGDTDTYSVGVRYSLGN